MSTGTPHSPAESASEKVFATYQAQLALAGGYCLYELAGGSFLITRTGFTLSVPDLGAVRRFAEQVGAT